MPPETYNPGQIAVFGAVLAIASLGLVPIAVAAARHIFPQRVVFFARWGFSHVLLAFVLFLLAVQVSGGIFGIDEQSGPPATLHAMIVAEVPVVALIFAVMRRTHPDPREALGLEASGTPRAILAGLAVLVLLLPGIFGCGLLWPWLFEALGGSYRPQEVLTAFAGIEGAVLVWSCFLAIVVVPFLEELLFRGFLQPLLSQNFGEQGGIVLTSTLFAASHGFAAFLPIFVLSWILGAVMVRTHRLAAVWAMHAAFNALNLAVFLAFPGSRELVT